MASSSLSVSQFVTPGQILGSSDDFECGDGVYAMGNNVYASLLGEKQISPSAEKGGKPLLKVVRTKTPTVVPSINDIVTAKITKVFTRYAVADILCVGSNPLNEAYQGKIRREDVRAHEIDSVEIYKSFRPGDVVRAFVLSLGDSKSYYLSTARNELGVILANSAAGYPMVPISWQQMKCPVSAAVEFRKVAKIEASTSSILPEESSSSS